MLRPRPRGLRFPPPERRRRSDLVAGGAIAVAVALVAALLWATAPHTGTVSTPAARPVAAPSEPADVPDGFTEAWRARNGASPVPVVAGPVVVTGDGDTVDGRDAATGAVRWGYRRDVPLCAVAAAFPDRDDGRALALYRNGDRCSEMTSLHPDTGARDRQRNLDVHPGTRLLDGGSLVTATGPAYLEVFRSDLVKTVEYGDVPTPRQVGRQPRPRCESTGFAATAGRLAVLQRCPDEQTERLTVLVPDGAEADKPQEEFSVLVPSTGATLVAASEDRVAVALPDPPRLQLLDRSGAQVGLVGLDVPDDDLARPPADGVAAVSGNGDLVRWWTGSRTVGLDGLDLTPVWTLPDTLGPGTDYAGRLLMPVPAGLAVVDDATGEIDRTLRVARPGRVPADAPVTSAVLGDVLLEQRGPDLVALRPSGDAALEEPDERQPADDQHGEHRGGQRPGAVAPAVDPDLGDHGERRRGPVADEHGEAGPGQAGPVGVEPPGEQHQCERDEPADEHPGQAARQAAAARAGHRASDAHGSSSAAAARPSGQCRRTSHDPQRGAGRAGNTTSRAPAAAVAPAMSDAASSIRARRSRNAASSCTAAVTSPLGRWCSSTRREGACNVRRAATA